MAQPNCRVEGVFRRGGRDAGAESADVPQCQLRSIAGGESLSHHASKGEQRFGSKIVDVTFDAAHQKLGASITV